jgi:endonuclease YncB( thermonuclease family)
MRVGGWASRVRLTGINAPECTKTSSSGTPFQHCSSSTEYFGLEAYQELKELVSGTNNKVNISCIEENQQCEKDMFDRYLAYLYLPDKRDIGEVLLQKGMVLAFTRYDHARTAAYCRAEAQAIRNRVGMWKNGRDYVKERMSSATKAWYYHKTSSQTHDAICSKALGQSFAKMAGE